MNYTSNPTAEDQLQLTEMINEDRYARTLANIARRAETLFADGYKATPSAGSAHFQSYLVTTPAGEFYMVCLSDTPKCDVFGDYCTCPAFTKYHECKHHLAILWRCQEEAQAAAFDALMGGAETETGCDPHSEF